MKRPDDTACPHTHPVGGLVGGAGPAEPELSKREQFAMAALQGLCARSTFADDELMLIAQTAVEAADFTLAELDKEVKE